MSVLTFASVLVACLSGCVQDVVPILVDLCNPNLRAKQSHMTEVDALLGVELLSEELSLGNLLQTDLAASCVRALAPVIGTSKTKDSDNTFSCDHSVLIQY